MEDVPLKSALTGRGYGSVSIVSAKKQFTRRLRLRSVVVSVVFSVSFAALIGICLNQIFTENLDLTQVHQTDNLQDDSIYDHLIHLYHTGRRDDTNYEGDCTTVDHDGKDGVKDCFLKCKADRGCKSFIYDTKSKNCCGSTSYEPGYSVPGHTNWYQMQVFGPQCKVVKVYSNTMRPTDKAPSDWSDVSSSLKGCVRTKTLEECLGKCVSSSSCVAFNYARSGGMCCGSTDGDPGALGMGVDFLVLPKDGGNSYNPEQDCYHQVKTDITVGGTASLTDLFSGPGATKMPLPMDGTGSVQGVVTRIADSAKDAAKDAGSLNEFMKELFPEKFGLAVGASSVNVGDIKAAPAVAPTGNHLAGPATAPTMMAATASTGISPSAQQTGQGGSVAPTRHVHGAPLPANAKPLLSSMLASSTASNTAGSITNSNPALRSPVPTTMSSPATPMINGAVRSSSIPLQPSFGPDTTPPLVLPVDASASLRAAAGIAPLVIPDNPQDALAQAQEILAAAEERAAELIASASGVPKAPAANSVSSKGHTHTHQITRH